MQEKTGALVRRVRITAWPALVLGVSGWVEGEKREERERGLARDGRRGYLFWHEAGHGRFVSLCVMGTGGWKRHKTACASRLRQLSQGIPDPTDPRRHADWLRAGLVPQNGSSRALCGTPTDGSPQSPSREGAVVVPWDRQRGAQRRVNGPWAKGQGPRSRSRLPGLPSKTRNWFNQTVCRQGSKLSLGAWYALLQPGAAQWQPPAARAPQRLQLPGQCASGVPVGPPQWRQWRYLGCKYRHDRCRTRSLLKRRVGSR